MAGAQAGTFFADRAEGCVQASLGPGSTLLIPASWPHAVVTQEDAVVVGGNFLHALDLRCASAHPVEAMRTESLSMEGVLLTSAVLLSAKECCSGQGAGHLYTHMPALAGAEQHLLPSAITAMHHEDQGIRPLPHPQMLNEGPRLELSCGARRAVECWEMETRLKVHASARFPLFGPLMWHTVAHYSERLLRRAPAGAGKPSAALTAWELTGLMYVLSFLKRQTDKSGWLAYPECLEDPQGLSS